jgi:hypothetical protein
MKKIIVLVVVILLIVFLYPKSYISSAGFVTQEANAEFESTKATCYGYSYLTNAEAMAADAPGKSLCFGWLKKSTQDVKGTQESVDTSNAIIDKTAPKNPVTTTSTTKTPSATITLVRDTPGDTSGPLRWKDGESYKHFPRSQSIAIQLSFDRVFETTKTDVILINPRECEGPEGSITTCSGDGIPYTIGRGITLPGSFTWKVGQDVAGKSIPTGAYRVCVGTAERCSEVNYVLNMTYGTLGID